MGLQTQTIGRVEVGINTRYVSKVWQPSPKSWTKSEENSLNRGLLYRFLDISLQYSYISALS